MLIFLWPRTSLPLPTMIFSMHLIVISATCFKRSHMKGVVIWNDLCTNEMWCFLSVFRLSTLHSINQWSCLLSSAFAWGQARSKLGGSWYVHFASLFLYHNLLLFVDIYHIGVHYLCYFTCFACLMIIGE